MNEELKNILTSLNVNGNVIDVAHIKYKGNKRTYVTWTLLTEEVALSYDDEIQYSLVPVDIDIYSDSNYLDIMKEIKNIMKKNEWNWIEDSPEMYEEETGLYHRTSTFEKERKI